MSTADKHKCIFHLSSVLYDVSCIWKAGLSKLVCANRRSLKCPWATTDSFIQPRGEGHKQTYSLKKCSHLIFFFFFVFVTAKLVIESVSFGLVRIRGSATDFYLCVDKRGRLRARVSLTPFLGTTTKCIALFFHASLWKTWTNGKSFKCHVCSTFLEPEPAYNGYSNYVIKSIFVLCFENTVTLFSLNKRITPQSVRILKTNISCQVHVKTTFSLWKFHLTATLETFVTIFSFPSWFRLKWF